MDPEIADQEDEARRLETSGMGVDPRGFKTFINNRADMHCVQCKREIIIGEFRYPISTSGASNRCSECFYSVAERVENIAKEYPMIPHTRSSRLFSTVRRMKVEKEQNIPIKLRNAFVYSTQTMTAEQAWEKFYSDSCNELKTDYPELYAKIFPEG